MTDAMRRFQPSWRVRECARLAGWGYENIQIKQGESGWSWGHVHRCGNVWLCPACAHQICSERAAELTRAVDWWRSQDMQAQADVVLLTLTVRHKEGDGLRRMRQDVSHAWRALQQTRAWRNVREDCGIEHMVRSQEVTLGPNGWHPHVHVLLFCRCPARIGGWKEAITWQWRHAVKRFMGDEHVPSRSHAIAIDACSDASYIARIGLELASPAAKHAREGHGTAMQLAERLTQAKGDEQDRLAALWREYAEGMRGAHQLQWSRGLREALGVEPSDEQIVDDEPKNKLVICEIPQETWRAMALARGVAQFHALGRSQHGLPLLRARDAILAYFALLEDRPCRWKLRGGTVALRWDGG